MGVHEDWCCIKLAQRLSFKSVVSSMLGMPPILEWHTSSCSDEKLWRRMERPAMVTDGVNSKRCDKKPREFVRFRVKGTRVAEWVAFVLVSTSVARRYVS